MTPTAPHHKKTVVEYKVPAYFKSNHRHTADSVNRLDTLSINVLTVPLTYPDQSECDELGIQAAFNLANFSQLTVAGTFQRYVLEGPSVSSLANVCVS